MVSQHPNENVDGSNHLRQNLKKTLLLVYVIDVTETVQTAENKVKLSFILF